MKKIKSFLSVILIVCLLSLTFLPVSAASYVLGDADGDGSATIMDVTLIQRALTSISYDDNGELKVEKDGVFYAYLAFHAQQGYTDQEISQMAHDIAKRADVDRNGIMEIDDATFIQRYDINLPTPYPIGEVIEDPTEAPTEAPTQAPTQKPTAKPDPYELPPI